MYFRIERAEHISRNYPGEGISHFVAGYMYLMQLFTFYSLKTVDSTLSVEYFDGLDYF